MVNSLKQERIFNQEQGTGKNSEKTTQKTRKFMLNRIMGLRTAGCLAVSVLLGASTSAAIIYDNTETFFGERTGEPNGTEIGDVVIFGGTDRLLSEIHIEYFLGGNTGGNEMAQVFMRAMDGPVLSGTTRAPGTLLYSTPAFNIESGYHTIDVTGIGGVTLPDSVAYTVIFSGLEAHPETVAVDDEVAGLLFYSSPGTGVGTNPTFFDPVANAQVQYSIRRASDGTWDLLNHPGVNDNFGARIVAVPEPGTLAILLGGLAMLGLVRRRKA
jgi:hypothetical protein